MNKILNDIVEEIREYQLDIAHAFMAGIVLGLILSISPLRADEMVATSHDAAQTEMCLKSSDVSYTKVMNDREILFYMRGGSVFKNTMQTDCKGLGYERGFYYVQENEKICSNQEQIEVMSRGTICPLGQFSSFDPNKPDESVTDEVMRSRDQYASLK